VPDHLRHSTPLAHAAAAAAAKDKLNWGAVESQPDHWEEQQGTAGRWHQQYKPAGRRRSSSSSDTEQQPCARFVCKARNNATSPQMRDSYTPTVKTAPEQKQE
jgi:hypothetical protein